MRKVRYVYGITAALLIGGSMTNVAVGPVGAQTAINAPGAISAPPPRAGAPMSFADLAERLQPAVVNISTRQSITIPRRRALPPGFEEFFRRFGGEAPQQQQQDNQGGGGDVTQRGGSLGSGFIISADGYIVTNNHVVAPARSNAVVEAITVTLPDRTEYEAEVVGRDEASDLAVLKINPRGRLPFVQFANPNAVRVGDWVVAIGNPYALGGSVTAGIVSALHRNIGAGNYDRFIQTDASINSGNSGGPLFDLQGNVIGINTALYSPTGGNIGIGFAIPAEQAIPIVESLRRGERVRRGYIGVTLQQIDTNLAAPLGLPANRGELISSVTPGGPAARGGVEQGDVVVSVAGQPVTPDATVAYLISQQPIGSRVPIEVIRDGQRRRLTIAIAERPSDQELARLNGLEVEDEGEADKPGGSESTGQASARASLGMSLQTLTPELARRGGLNGDVRGVVVTALDPNSDAAQKGLRTGDVILSINRAPATTPEA
ncbi:MAG: protease, partial [Alphaproteobacteria bacterium]|nr:protease [Alphaproteobacteria bacterium]